VQYYCKLPDHMEDRIAIVVDPMLATGNSSAAAVTLLKKAGAGRSASCACWRAPEGIARMKEAHPDVPIVTAAVDSHLNDHGYIVPGLGDAGDRMFGTTTERAATAAVKGTVVSAGGAAGFRLACPADTPVAQRFEIYGGGSKVLCTRGDGSLEGANFPRLIEGSVAGYPTGYDAYVAAGAAPATPGPAPAAAADATYVATKGGGTVRVVEAPAKVAKSAKYPPVAPPAGYKAAWKDDRLNPQRGKQTVEGVIDQDEIWTRTVPAELREDWGKPKAPLTIVVRKADGTMVAHDGVVVSTKGDGSRVVKITGPGKVVTKSTKTEPKAVVKTAPAATAAAKAKAKPVAGGRLFVQVGSFGVAANADGTAARLKSAGLPVARGKAKGGALTVVYAGPFATAGEAKAALSAARGMGFGDARIVQ
jgi:hypothetical protein